MTPPRTLSEICIATDRFHEVVQVQGLKGRRLCQNCGLWDTFIQEEHGPEPYPPSPYGPGGPRRRLP